MKTIKIIMVVVVGLLAGISNTEAQQAQNRSQVNKAAMENFTEAQKLMLQEQRELIKQNRETFKASLSAEQLAILENAALTKQERRQALVASFTKAQQQLLQQQKMNMQAIRQQFKSTLTDGQLQQIRTRLRSHENIQDGKELMESVMHRRKNRNN